MAGTYINASEAHRKIIQAGIEISYPTAIKWMESENLITQPTGKYGAMVVDKEGLEQAILSWRSKNAGETKNDDTVETPC